MRAIHTLPAALAAAALITNPALGETAQSEGPPKTTAVSFFGIRTGDDLATVLENPVVRQGQLVEDAEFLYGQPMKKADQPFKLPENPLEVDPSQQDPRQYESYLKHAVKRLLLAYTENQDPPKLMDRPVKSLLVEAVLDLDDKRWKVVRISSCFSREYEDFLREMLDNQFGGPGWKKAEDEGARISLSSMAPHPITFLQIEDATLFERSLYNKLEKWGLDEYSRTHKKPNVILE